MSLSEESTKSILPAPALTVIVSDIRLVIVALPAPVSMSNLLVDMSVMIQLPASVDISRRLSSVPSGIVTVKEQFEVPDKFIFLL